MEAASLPQQQAPPGKRVADFVSAQILWILFGAVLLVLFIGNTTQTAENVKDGLSVGLIWALIALGYTLVYGIIELINFAHGEVFMIGSFIAVSLWSTLGVVEGDSVFVISASILLALVVSMLTSGSLNVMIERVA